MTAMFSAFKRVAEHLNKASTPQRMASLGIDVPLLLRRAGLPASLFSRGAAKLTTRQFFELWRALEGLDLGPDFGSRAGTQPPPDQYDTSYQQLLDEVRQDTARRLLATDMRPGENAFLLGFEEINSFKRAFSEWEGTTPNRRRAVRITQ
jgi:AraC-like DNA-binding protein